LNASHNNFYFRRSSLQQVVDKLKATRAPEFATISDFTDLIQKALSSSCLASTLLKPKALDTPKTRQIAVAIKN